MFKYTASSVFIGFATIIFPWAVWMSSAGNTSDADDSARVAADIWKLIIYVPILIYNLVKMIHSAVKHKPFSPEAILLVSLAGFFAVFLILTSL